MEKERIAIVTGGSMGIGESLVRLLVDHGHRVVIADIADEKGQALAAELNASRESVEYIHADVSDSSAVAGFFKQVVDRFGRTDWLINNAGIALAKSTQATSEEEWDLILDVNLKGAWLCSKHAIPLMAKSEGAAIVNVASNAGLVGFPNLAAYCASKGGLIQLTRACALDCASMGIRVNAVAPGHTRTPMGDGFIQAQEDPDAFVDEFINQRHPIGRMARPEEVASAIYFLLSEASSFVTGAVLSVDGGYVAR